jgi:hypothetical protein
MYCESWGPVSPERPFSALQAVTQSLQPSPHLVVSMSMPQRLSAEAPSSGARLWATL